MKSIDDPAMASDKPFQGLASLARRHFGIDAALVAWVDADRQWRAAGDGLSAQDGRCALSLCTQAGLGAGTCIVPDTLADRRLRGHPAVTGALRIRFFAFCPFTGPDEIGEGGFCLLGRSPRDLDDRQLGFLRDLARLAADAVELSIVQSRSNARYHRLLERERTTALALAGGNIGIWDRNVQTDQIQYSTDWKAILGYSDQEIGSLITDSYTRVHPDDLARVRAAIQDHFDRKTPAYHVEHRLRCKDGGYKWVLSRGKVVDRDDRGKPLRMVGTTTDVTAMREMSEKLRQTLALVTSLTNEVPGLVFQYRRLANGDALFPYASAGIREIYEVEPEEVAECARALDDLIHPDDLAAYHASFDLSAQCLAPWHLEYRVQLPRQGLRWRQGDAQPQRLDDGSTLWHGFITDVTERKHIEAELQRLASTDSLTQLPNRRHFMACMETELARIRRGGGKPAAVLMCDLDHFKLINDTWGHAVGDIGLRHFADMLRGQLRKTDAAGRMGGEEFAILLIGTGFAGAETFARRLQSCVARVPLVHAGKRIGLTVSIGIAVMTADDVCAVSSLARSDKALYRAKENGRDRIERQ